MDIVLDGYLGFVQDTAEWTGTDIVFEVYRTGDTTELRFTHIGLASATSASRAARAPGASP